MNDKIFMKCDKCKEEFEEKNIEESHDVPCYLFEGFNRKERKQRADKFTRHWLCKKCHLKYDNGLKQSFKVRAIMFRDKFFEGLE